jgi:mRNA interferase RelE/StbE
LTYELMMLDEALDKLEKLDAYVRLRIMAKLTATKENPHHFFERLKGLTSYKLRVGQYRIIADIIDAEEQIIVSNLGLRSKIYDDL